MWGARPRATNPSSYASARRSRRSKRGTFLQPSSCCQIRRTRQPRARSPRVTTRSRARLSAIFFRQNRRLVLGREPCFGQPCQKQPSTKMTTRCLGKAKSGFPNKGVCRLQPRMPCARRSRANTPSVCLLPRERMRDITSERLVLLKMSAMRTAYEERRRIANAWGCLRSELRRIPSKQ